MKKQIPNILSGFRVVLVGVFVWLFHHDRILEALLVFVTAFLTDLLDGFLARRNGWITDIGKVLDPLADKLMLLSALICFYLRDWIPFWLVALVVFKEALMIFGGAILFRKKVVVYADWYGKIAAGIFNAAVVATLAKYYCPQLGVLNIILFCVALLLALIALVHYAIRQALPRWNGKHRQ